MLLIVVVAFIATMAFYRQAKRIGVHPGKAASLPFLGTGILLIAANLVWLFILRLANDLHASPLTVNAIQWMLSGFVLLGYLAWIRRNWLSLNRKPPNENVGSSKE